VYLAKDDNSGIEKWEIYSINRLNTSKAEEEKPSVFTIYIGLSGSQLTRLSTLI
jgi:hypothetical protein